MRFGCWSALGPAQSLSLLRFMVGAPPDGGPGRARRNINWKHQPRAHTLRRLVAATGTSHTTVTLCAIAPEIDERIENIYKNSMLLFKK